MGAVRHGHIPPAGVPAGTPAGRPGAAAARRLRRGALAAVCTAVLLPVWVPGVAYAEDDGEDGGAAGPTTYTMAADARPVEGTASTADAPRIEADALYTDSIEPNETLYYSVVLDEVSGWFLSAVAAPAPGTRVASSDGIRTELKSTGGESCNNDSRTFGADDAARPIAAWATRVVDPDRNCQAAGTYLLEVTRTSEATSDPAPWPMELRVMREPEVLGGDTSAPHPGTWLDEMPPAPTGSAERVVGGTGFNDARSIGEGVWRDDIAPGQTLFYRVPVDWHQQPAVTVELANSPTGDGFTSVYQALVAEVYNPARARIVGVGNSYSGEQIQVEGFAPAPVAYDHRFEGDSDVTRARFAGWHHLVIHLHRDVEQVTDADSIGLTIRLSVEGEPPAEPPLYDGDPFAAGFGVTEEDRRQAEQGLSDADVAAERRDTRQLFGFAGIGAGVALLVVLGGWTLLGRRSAARSG
ncbi:hypothetical protein GCM10027160_35400 [Streptomyces calidiresistens]|uniref:Uncharacterized protein n=1 Tax=Streptomyces calidiresistens TaxID=1485586 RepID=A0A7W3XVU1_9ACTN|nr:hypothetical protein [Streptomyces calidiresistens]MBB0229148.1 hypothetical protein [Streptomyces calidiresistens]